MFVQTVLKLQWPKSSNWKERLALSFYYLQVRLKYPFGNLLPDGHFIYSSTPAAPSADFITITLNLMAVIGRSEHSRNNNGCWFKNMFCWWAAWWTSFILVPVIWSTRPFLINVYLTTTPDLSVIFTVGEKNILIPCWFCKFAHWQRNDLSVILMVGLFEQWETE